MNGKIDLISFPKKSFWKLSIPVIAFCIFDAIYGIVDMAWVSGISTEAFFAIGVSIPVVTLVFSFGDSIGQGTNSIMSRFIGSGDYESAYNALVHGIMLANMMWFVCVLSLLFANGILSYMKISESYILILDYLFPIIVSAYVFMFNNLFSETLQAEGDSITPTALIMASNILNIILDPIFIYYLNLGIRGAAYATIISAFLVLIPILYLYESGKTKVPLSLKYFKFRPYIIVEIFKVTLPNMLDNAVWCISASFINSILIMTMGTLGPILYSASNKLKTLLVAPIKGYGRGLMSVAGQLFGAHKFDNLNEMFRYVLKISFLTTVIVMVIFIFLRDYLFSIFAITGMHNEIFWIAIAGTLAMFASVFSIISSKMLDAFGKSMYSLLFTIIRIVFEIGLIYVLASILNDASSVLIGIVISDIAISVVYYLFMKYLLGNLDKNYENKQTVKTFRDEVIAQKTEDKTQTRRILIILALFSMIFIIIEAFAFLFIFEEYSIVFRSVIAIIAAGIVNYLLEKLNKPLLAIASFMIISITTFTLLGNTSYFNTLAFLVTVILVLHINKTITRLNSN